VPASPTGHTPRHRTATRLPGPVGLASLVAVLLVTFGAGAALLPPSFASSSGRGGAGGGPAAAQQAPVAAAAPAERGLGAADPTRTGKDDNGKKADDQRSARGAEGRARGGNAGREDEVTALVNQERAADGCRQRVRTDERLRRAARGHSRDMAARNYFSHDSQDGRSPWDRAEAAGYKRAIGENIAKGQRTPREVVRAWMDSPGHRANILNCNAKAIGVGLAFDGDTPIWTQLFGAE
jgi:uncharacterized protein YkwD